MGFFNSGGLQRIEVTQDIGLVTGEIGDIYQGDDEYIYWGEGQDGSMGFNSTTAQLELLVPDANPAVAIIEQGDTITNAETVTHPTLLIYDNGATDFIGFFNDDTRSHILSEVGNSGACVDLRFFRADATGDQPNIQLDAYAEVTTTEVQLYFGSDTVTTTEELYWRFGVVSNAGSNELLHTMVIQMGNSALPASNAVLLALAATNHPALAITDFGNTDAVIIYHDDTDGHLDAWDEAGGTSLAIQGKADVIPGDVTFFQAQADPGTAAMAAGEVPEIRIYGWDHVADGLNQVILRVLSVEEGIDPTDDEMSYFNIAIDQSSSRYMIITDDSSATPEITAAASHPTLRIYDSGNTDFIEFFHDDSEGHINAYDNNGSYPTDLAFQSKAKDEVGDVTFFQGQTNPGDTVDPNMTPEIRIYGWDQADNQLGYNVLRTISVAENQTAQNDEHAYFNIGVDPAGSRVVVIAESSELFLEITTVASHPTLRIYDTGGTDYISFTHDDTEAQLVATHGIFRFSDLAEGDDSDALTIVTTDGVGYNSFYIGTVEVIRLYNTGKLGVNALDAGADPNAAEVTEFDLYDDLALLESWANKDLNALPDSVITKNKNGEGYWLDQTNVNNLLRDTIRQMAAKHGKEIAELQKLIADLQHRFDAS